MSDMLVIQALDDTANLQFSKYTSKWYVDSALEIGDGCILSGIVEHRDNPEQAIYAFMETIKAVEYPKFVVGRYAGKRREWRWNGQAFAECTREVAL